ncbi:fatty-acyl-CoA synthase [Variovorax sp. HW608]|uniref:class I adenylate-forming enzyme family protein n=1 Tax=Variovorax sp. HW608 TaxID=1034889 RepID=UPI00081FD53F|nr:AMP-binding protein [Variovorax sp. HW608]SCK25878.1 fatty-acyl-CoA synthase [Variovorax sp. HW608]
MHITSNASHLPDTLYAALQDAAQRYPGVAAYIDSDQAHRFAEMQAAADLLATAMLRLGLSRGDRIAILAYNQIEWLQLFFAAARIGVAVVALSPRYRDAEIEYMLADSRVRAVFTMSRAEDFDYLAMFEHLSARLSELRDVIAIGGVRFRELAAVAPDPFRLASAAQDVSPDDLAMVIYTSGTTGRPKGCALTHASLLASARAQARHTRIQPGELLQLSNPLNHVGGITCGVLSQMVAGGSCELVPVFKAKTVLDMIRRRPPAILVGVPTMMTLLLTHPEAPQIDLNTVRLIITGGSNVDQTLLSHLRQRMPRATVMNLYGLSEASGALVMTPWACSDRNLMETIGTALQGAEVRITDPGGRALSPGQIGELQFRGLGVVRDYIGAASNPDAFAGGWLRTGDLGSMDERGYITLKGRMKDMYIQGGFNVYPAEVEALIATHPNVLMVAGIGIPDPVLGEVGRYFVIPKEGCQLDAAEIVAWCTGKIADYKLPRQVELRTQLPLTPAGKIHKAQLRAETAQSAMH